MNEKKKNFGLEVGETYLSGKLDLGALGSYDFSAFKNKNKEVGSNQPDFKGKNIAIWINQKKSETKVITEEKV